MSITRNFNLYLNAGREVPLVINVSQYDQGETWIFTLYNSDGTQYLPTTGSIVGIKADGNLIANAGSVNSGGQVVITETEQMTASAGKATFELQIDSDTHGTANFVVMVEKSPTEGGTVSDSDLSLLQEALDATSPLPTGGTVGQVLTKTSTGSAWSDAGNPTDAQVAEATADWLSENITVTSGVTIDTSLSVSGAAADAKVTGDAISILNSAISSITNVPTTAVRQAIYNLFNSAGYGNNDVSADLTVVQSWASETTAISLSDTAIAITGSGTVQLTATTTPSGNAVSWTSSDTSVATVSSGGLVTGVGNGSCTITATSGNKSATCTATITGFATLVSISAVYSGGMVFSDATIDDLKSDLVVTAAYDDSTTATIASADYNLSGTLSAGTCTITVSYGGKTDTFTVTVSAYIYELESAFSSTGSNYVDTGIEMTASSAYTVMAEFTITSVGGSVAYIFGNKGSRTGNYLAFQTQNAYLWGSGISWNSGANLAVSGHKYRFVMTLDTTTYERNTYVRDITASGTTVSGSSTTTSEVLPNNFYIGAQSQGSATSDGFTGTVSQFMIDDSIMESADITTYLAG